MEINDQNNFPNDNSVKSFFSQNLSKISSFTSKTSVQEINKE
jgi:hypothetical protein